MPIKTKRWCDRRSKDDGYRILVCRYRPRALPKAKETWDTWLAVLGPSKELHADLYGKHGRAPTTWADWKHRYVEEMKGPVPAELIDELAALVAEGKTITLLCSRSCNDESHCHRTLLKELIEARLAVHLAERGAGEVSPQAASLGEQET